MKLLQNCTYGELLEQLHAAILAADDDWIVAVEEAMAYSDGGYDDDPDDEEEDFDLPDDVDETGFNPYMGDYDWDC